MKLHVYLLIGGGGGGANIEWLSHEPPSGVYASQENFLFLELGETQFSAF